MPVATVSQKVLHVVATCPRCSDSFSVKFISNLMQNPTVKQCRKSVSIWQSHGQKWK